METELINAYVSKQKEVIDSLMSEVVSLQTNVEGYKIMIERYKKNMPEFKIKQLTHNGITKELLWDGRDLSCFDILQHEWKEFYEVLEKLQSRRGVVIQAGGNCGLYPFYLSEMFERVFTFEPDPVNFFCLSQNCKNSKIIKYNTALGNACEFINISNEDPTNNGMVKVSDHGTAVFSMTIDSLNLTSLDLIFLDVEGFEMNVFAGAEDTIKRTRPNIIFELTKDKDQIFDFFEELNYQQAAIITGNTTTYIFIPK